MHTVLEPRRILCCFALIASLTVACGDEAGEQPVSVHLPWQAPLPTCSQRLTFGASLEAILEIGGHDPCPLSVDPVTLEASGSCDSITIGIVRPLGLGYWLPHPTDPNPVPLAFLIGWVDLRKESLDRGAETKTVALVADGISGRFIHRESDVAALPDGDANNNATDEATYNMFKAEKWARTLFTDSQGRLISFFDLNTGNTTSNLEEACAGTLFP